MQNNNNSKTTIVEKLRSLKVIKWNSCHIIVVDSILIRWLHFSSAMLYRLGFLHNVQHTCALIWIDCWLDCMIVSCVCVCARWEIVPLRTMCETIKRAFKICEIAFSYVLKFNQNQRDRIQCKRVAIESFPRFIVQSQERTRKYVKIRNLHDGD